MKNLTLLVAALLLAGQTFAQSGLEFTLGYTPGLSFILNDDDLAAGKELNYRATYGSQFGLTVGYNFNERLGLATGLGIASINQNYITDINGLSKDQQLKSSRQTTYLRVPVLFRIGGNPSAATSAFFRFGPHFDFLTGAVQKVGNDKTNLRDFKKLLSDEKYKIFSDVTIGLTLEAGARIRLSDMMGLLVLFHLEGSLTNPEGKDANLAFIYGGTDRARSWSVMPGVNLSFQYVLNFK